MTAEHPDLTPPAHTLCATPGERWRFTLSTLLGETLPDLPAVPGRVIVARDEPIPAECLIGVTDPTELARLLGVSRKAAEQRLQQAETTGAPSISPASES